MSPEANPPAVVLGQDCRVFLGNRRDIHGYPQTAGGHVLRARLKDTSSNGERLVFAGEDVRCLIIHVISEDLLFEGIEPLADDLGLWPGGDGETLPFRQYGRNNSRRVQQMYAIDEGQWIYVTDNRAAVVRVRCENGLCVISQVEVPEAVEFIFKRAKAQKSRASLTWGIRNLENLQRTGVLVHKTRNAIAELHALVALA
ncbi:MAG: hypothetical protein AB203_02835 [Parcubacteria bacterium C7867-008]|nr:MAG: hypothetical protein AB203_02835 [Parcubacteria bacterium C7867-008]